MSLKLICNKICNRILIQIQTMNERSWTTVAFLRGTVKIFLIVIDVFKDHFCMTMQRKRFIKQDTAAALRAINNDKIVQLTVVFSIWRLCEL